MKRFLTVLLVVALVLSMSACGNSKETEAKARAKEAYGCGDQSLAAVTTETLPEENCNITETAHSTENSGREVTESDILGRWEYLDSVDGYREEIVFKDGVATCSSVTDGVPDKVYTCVGEYTVYPDYISLYFVKTDYTNRIDCGWLGDTLVLYKYIDTGADKGNTRIFTKENGEPLIQSSGGDKKSVPKETERNASSGERNALQSAKDYLALIPFSYSGLVEQLEYEGYTNSEATYAADHCGADWYEQAVKSAQQYLDIMPFSRSGLIEQLEYDGYDYDQAVYGVDKAY